MQLRAAVPPGGQIRLLAMGLIDEPAEPIRQSFDREGLEELAGSLQRVGLLNPILVHETNGRFRIDAGHRRYLAARIAGLVEIPAIIMVADGELELAVRLHENAYREDLNPAEEALWLYRLYDERCDGDMEKLVALTRQKKPYLDERLLLAMGDPEVFDAVRRGAIPMAVARELNKYADAGQRKLRLMDAVSSGAPARQVREWRQADERLTQATAEAVARGLAPVEDAVVEGVDPLTCFLCGGTDDKHEMRHIYVHVGCRKAAERGLGGQRLNK